MIREKDAVIALYSEKHPAGTGIRIDGDCEKDLSGVILGDGSTLKFSFNDVLKKKKELQDDYDSKQYQRDRAVSFPPLAEQMDILYHGGVDALKAELKKTKDKYPKP